MGAIIKVIKRYRDREALTHEDARKLAKECLEAGEAESDFSAYDCHCDHELIELGIFGQCDEHGPFYADQGCEECRRNVVREGYE
jgi:hypothetical protein